MAWEYPQSTLDTGLMTVCAMGSEVRLKAIRVDGEPQAQETAFLGAFYDSWNEEAQQLTFHNKANTPIVADSGDYILMSASGDVSKVSPVDFAAGYYSV